MDTNEEIKPIEQVDVGDVSNLYKELLNDSKELNKDIRKRLDKITSTIDQEGIRSNLNDTTLVTSLFTSLNTNQTNQRSIIKDMTDLLFKAKDQEIKIFGINNKDKEVDQTELIKGILGQLGSMTPEERKDITKVDNDKFDNIDFVDPSEAEDIINQNIELDAINQSMKNVLSNLKTRSIRLAIKISEDNEHYTLLLISEKNEIVDSDLIFKNNIEEYNRFIESREIQFHEDINVIVDQDGNEYLLVE